MENVLSIVSPQQIEPLDAGFTVAKGVHRHMDRVIDSYELFFVERGTLHMYEEQTAFVIGPGECLLLWPGRRQGGTATYEPDLRFCWLHFRFAEMPGEPYARVPQHSKPGNSSRVMQLFHWYLAESKSSRLSAMSRQLIVALLLGEMALPSEDSEAGVEPLVRQADEIIHVSYDKPISASDIAEMLSCSLDHLSRIYRKARGISITAALIQRRINVAAALLIRTDKPVERIGEECGFNDNSYFRRTFRRYYGISPAAYRRCSGNYPINSDCDYDMGEEDVT